MKKIILFFFVIASTAKQSHSQNSNLTLAGHLSYGTQELSNIWGWKSPVDGKEYALVGAADGLSIVDVTNPSSPVEIVEVPAPDTAAMHCVWREVKTRGNYAYVTTECGHVGLQIIDLSTLPATNLPTATWTPTYGTDTLKTIHALHIEKGKLYLYGYGWQKGVLVADVNTTPMNPVLLARYDAGGYIHDGYVQGDTMYAAHIWNGQVEVADMSNPAAPVTLATFTTPGAFTHNTWLSSDSKICYTTDEVNSGYLAAFDVSDLSNVTETDRIQTDPGSNVIVHNTYIVRKNNNDYAVTSWYKDGVIVVDAGRPNNLVQVGNYDTSPLDSSGYGGCWGVYPYLPSGTIVASDIETGLYVFTPTYTRACYLEGKVTDCNTGNAVAGVNVEIQLLKAPDDANKDLTDGNGDYAVGVQAAGTYLVVFSKTGFITDTDTVVMSTGVVNVHNFQLCPMGIKEEKNLVQVNVFPNPFAETTTLRITNGERMTGYELKIADVYGNAVFPVIICNAEEYIIDRSDLASGIYFYCLTRNGKAVARGKLMIE